MSAVAMAPGVVLLPRNPVAVAASRMDASNAMVASVAAYLRCVQFCIWGADAPDVEFLLNEVQEQWPEPTEILDYPSASVVSTGITDLQGHNLVPTPLEETLDEFGVGTVLWKVAEAAEELQVDFWAQSKPTIEAIAAAIPGLFSPGEGASRVVLSGHPVGYYRPVRATLLNYSRPDNQNTVFSSERRLTARVQCEIDVVELRCASRVMPQPVIVQIGESVDATDPEPEVLTLDLVPGD